MKDFAIYWHHNKYAIVYTKTVKILNKLAVVRKKKVVSTIILLYLNCFKFSKKNALFAKNYKLLFTLIVDAIIVVVIVQRQ